MKTVKFTQQELRIVTTYLQANPCLSGCAWDEMGADARGCTECHLSTGVSPLLEKLEAGITTLKKEEKNVKK